MTLLGFAPVAFPTEETSFENVVGDIDRAARSLYVLGLYLCEHQEEDTGSAAILLSETIHRRVKMLEAFAERPMPPTA